jgi:hypothetical protein
VPCCARSPLGTGLHVRLSRTPGEVGSLSPACTFCIRHHHMCAHRYRLPDVPHLLVTRSRLVLINGISSRLWENSMMDSDTYLSRISLQQSLLSTWTRMIRFQVRHHQPRQLRMLLLVFVEAMIAQTMKAASILAPCSRAHFLSSQPDANAPHHHCRA